MPLLPPPPLSSQRLQIRVVEEDDIPGLFDINSDEVTTRYLPYAPWQTLADGNAWFDRIMGYQAQGTTLQFAIIEKESGRVIGACLLFRYEEASARAEIGYVLGRPYWGKGYAREALSLLIDAAFGIYGLRRLEAEVNPANIASIRLLEKLGFTHEGRLRQRWFAKGNVYDTNIYGLLCHEWPDGPLKEGMPG